ncbi:MAG TPA: hypothetical protein VMI75_14560 [Polyangiaceae bacterium]|nr:hypothetical protein [Polyangiaceae bacterium]
MRRRLLIALPILVCLAGGILYWRSVERRRAAASAAQAHREHLNEAYAPIAAYMSAPPGETPCESAYNAFQAFAAKSEEVGQALPWESFPDKPTFLQRCSALPEGDQNCLEPRYQAKNLDACNDTLHRLRKDNVLYVSRGGPLGASH